VDVVLVELVEDRQIGGGLLGLVHFLVPSLCSSAFASMASKVVVLSARDPSRRSAGVRDSGR
jgi:hypothetical protein